MPATARASAASAPATAAPLPPVRAGFGLRAVRAVPFATVCVALAAAGHVLATGAGTAIPLPALLFGWLAVGAAAVGTAGSERSLPALCGGLGVAQLALHMLFTHLSPHAASGASGIAEMTGMSDMAGMPGMAAVQQPAAASVGTAAVAPHAGLLGMSPQMFAAHLLAALAAGWWLRRGEAAIWRLVRLGAKAAEAAGRACAAALRGARLLAAARPGGWAAPPARPIPPGTDDGWLRLPAPLRHSVIRRGPPTGATF
ncbi:hypothetical protein P3T36_005665 [Kitasatospora sp. MAP12-15]|uniref:hypothetical protein n=1 Tax=unclassified Kitasatospora TaxID=2633591 RepID=UPI002473FCE4|nr:hypothetical protein [Kitasatospora sp. MAP12-44]MDH6113823.1 hypothetical protein [Kitasatospora sp. MAP12-44]